MRIEKHLRLLVIVTIAWIIFLLAGYLDYYKQYHTEFMIVFDFIILPPICYVIYKSVKNAKLGKRLSISIWWSFYITVPLFIYDFIYCGLYLGYGLKFITLYWYLSVYYIIPWLFFPITGYLTDKMKIK